MSDFEKGYLFYMHICIIFQAIFPLRFFLLSSPNYFDFEVVWLPVGYLNICSFYCAETTLTLLWLEYA